MGHNSVTHLSLRDAQPLFCGSAREVFQHPHDPDLFVKVPRPKFRRVSTKPPRWKRRFRPLGGYSISFRELREFVRLTLTDGSVPLHISTVTGMVATDIGWGLLVRREQRTDGKLAPTLGQMIDAGRLHEAQPALENFVAWLEKTNAVIQDLHEDNVVFAERNGSCQIVLIDGFGDRSALMLRTYFPYLNRRRMRYFIRRFRHKIALRQARAAQAPAANDGHPSRVLEHPAGV